MEGRGAKAHKQSKKKLFLTAAGGGRETAMLQECCAPHKDMDIVHAEITEWRDHHKELEEEVKHRREAKESARKSVDGQVQVFGCRGPS